MLNFVAKQSTGLGSGILYTTKNNGADGRPRYDFVDVEGLSGQARFYCSDRKEETTQPICRFTSTEYLELGILTAQLICIIMIGYVDRRSPPEYYAIVQYLKKETRRRNDRSPFDKLTWEIHDRTQFMGNMVAIEMIKLAAIVIPHLSSQGHYTYANPSRDDKFCYLPRQFTDKSGWEELHNIAPLDNLMC